MVDGFQSPLYLNYPNRSLHYQDFQEKHCMTDASGTSNGDEQRMTQQNTPLQNTPPNPAPLTPPPGTMPPPSYPPPYAGNMPPPGYPPYAGYMPPPGYMPVYALPELPPPPHYVPCLPLFRAIPGRSFRQHRATSCKHGFPSPSISHAAPSRVGHRLAGKAGHSGL